VRPAIVEKEKCRMTKSISKEARCIYMVTRVVLSHTFQDGRTKLTKEFATQWRTFG